MVGKVAGGADAGPAGLEVKAVQPLGSAPAFVRVRLTFGGGGVDADMTPDRADEVARVIQAASLMARTHGAASH